jgi:hypothetical protein
MQLAKELVREEAVPEELQIKVEQLYGKHLEALSSSDERKFARRVVTNILRVAKDVKTHTDLLPTVEDLEDTLKDWLTDPQKGAHHTYEVYHLMLEMKQQAMVDGSTALTMSDRELEARAILYDIARFLPIYAQDNQQLEDKTWQLKRRAQLLSIFSNRLGGALGSDDAQQLARDMLYLNVDPETENIGGELSPAAKLLLKANQVSQQHKEEEKLVA